MFPFVKLVKTPIQIGKCSRGFIVDKVKLRLESSVKYVVLIIPEENYPRGLENEIDIVY